MARNSKPNRNDKRFQSDDQDKSFGKKKNFKKGKRGNYNSRKDSGSPSSNLPAHDTGGDNDISFWNGAGQLYLDATTLSTYHALGARHTSPYYDKDYYSPTGIARFDYIPFFGDITSSVHPLNTTAKIMYNAINSKNSRMPSYDPSDLMVYIMAVAQAWSIHSWVRRICGMFNTFSVVNRYWWEPICRSMGIEPINTDNDIVKWRNLANHMALLLNRLPVPDGIKYFKRTSWMNENIYMDSPVGKSTYYYFSPAANLKYTYDNDQIGQLSIVETPWHAALYDTEAPAVTPHLVEEYFRDIISNLFNDSDIPVIGADILKAFDGRIYSVGQIDSSFTLGPFYSPEVNLELHNARMNYGASHLLETSHLGDYRIYQDMTSNTLRTTKVDWRYLADISTAFAATDLKGGRAIAMDFPIDNPSNDDWMIASRLTWAAAPPAAGDEDRYAEILACTEVLINDAFFEFEEASGGEWTLKETDKCVLISVKSGATNMAERLTKATKLHDAPIIFAVSSAADSAHYSEPREMYILSDLTNYSTMSVEDLRNMHDVAQISVFLPDWLRATVGGK